MRIIYFSNGRPFYDERIERWSAINKKIADRDAYRTDTTLREFFADNAETNYVIVIPELCWEENALFDSGYEVALDLLNNKVEGKFFNLLFVSSLTREQLRREVPGKYHILIDAFPHFCLLDLPEGIAGLRYSRIHFEMIRRIAISETGRLDAVEHNLGSVVGRPLPEARKELLETVDILSLPVYLDRVVGGGETLQAIREKVEGLMEGGASVVADLVDDLQQIVGRVKNRLAVYRNGEEEERKPRRFPYRVLVVEDDRKYRDDLVSFLGEFFQPENIRALDDDEIRAAEGSIEKQSRDRDIIFLDMMYYDTSLEGKVWLPFNGLDLYRKVQDKTVRLITGLPRNEISRITEGCGLTPPVVITKRGGWEQLKSNLRARMDELIRDCENRKNRENAALQFPTNEPFRSMSLWLRRNPGALEDAILYSERVLLGERHLQGDGPVRLTKGAESKYCSELPKILAARRIALSYYNIEEAGETCPNYREYLERFIEGGKVPRNRKEDYYRKKEYFNTRLGLSFSESRDAIEIKNLFPFESRFVEEGNPLPGKLNEWAKALIADVRNTESRYDEELEIEYGEMPVALSILFSGEVMEGLLDKEREAVPTKTFAVFLKEILDCLKRSDIDNDTRLALWFRCDADPMPPFDDMSGNRYIRQIRSLAGEIAAWHL